MEEAAVVEGMEAAGVAVAGAVQALVIKTIIETIISTIEEDHQTATVIVEAEEAGSTVAIVHGVAADEAGGAVDEVVDNRRY